MWKLLLVFVLSGMSCFVVAATSKVIYKYVLNDNGTQRSYDETIAVGCFQGIINRNAPVLWVSAENEKNADFWEKTLTKDNGWLVGKTWIKLNTLDQLRKLAGDKVKGIVVWDPNVPATLNVGNTIAGAEDLVLLSPEFADIYSKAWKLEIKHDLRGKFDGSETGSAKNDAYRWAIREYLAKGKCSNKFIFLYDDSWKDKRATGAMRYSTGRDWIVYNKGFVFDLSPWGDEISPDDPNQKVGTDLETYEMILKTVYEQTNGKNMTELSGFFDFWKYSVLAGGKHGEVTTEWRTVHLITPYNVFQNTADHNCYNRSFHKYFNFKPLKQKINKTPKVKLEKKTYVCILMGDYDSATPLYAFLPRIWSDPRRGDMPLSWGINPNLLDSYPDVIDYYYKTATKNDFFVTDASCAGYFNPNRILPENMGLFIKHNQKYYNKLDMDISPMVLDTKEPSALVKDAFAKFSKYGMGNIIQDEYKQGNKGPVPQIWKGMSVNNLFGVPDSLLSGDYQKAGDYSEFAKWVTNYYMQGAKPDDSNFFYFRIVWVTPSQVIGGMEAMKKLRPDLNIEVVDPYTFFALQKEYHIKNNLNIFN